MKKLYFIFFLCFLVGSMGMKEPLEPYTLKISPVFEGEHIELNTKYGNDEVIFKTIKFYISGVAYVDSQNPEMAVISDARLFDLSENTLPLIVMDRSTLYSPNQLKLTLGTDSTSQMNDFLKGDLDPIHGMYWTWRSGYIHVKIEGSKNGIPFEYHLGGFQGPYASSVNLTFPLTPNKTEYRLDLPLDSMLSSDLGIKKTHIMSPGPEALKLMHAMATSAQLHTE